MARESNSFRGVVDQILGSISPTSVVKKLDTKISVQSYNPVAYLMQLV